MTEPPATSTTSTTTTITVVHCWSAPRSRSTALLYSFDARGDDTIALDEPLYREWLVQKAKGGVDTVERPYRSSLIDGISPDGENQEYWTREQTPFHERVRDAVMALSSKHRSTPTTTATTSGGVVFCKHMAKHSVLYNLEHHGGGLKCYTEIPSHIKIMERHILLIRDPVAVLSSWSNSSHVHGNSPTTDEVSIVPLLGIYSTLSSHHHSKLPVILLDSDDLVTDPIGTLRQVCDDLGIPYTDRMLTWSAGPKHCDGPWAKVSLYSKFCKKNWYIHISCMCCATS